MLAGVCLAAAAGLAPTPARADGTPPERSPWPTRQEDPDYIAGVRAIKAGNYPAAIRLVEGVVAREASNADALNWLAYATRRGGDPAKSIPIYERALAIDPKHRGAHEYIGEAYLALHNLAKAKEHLARLDSLCFFPCSEYRDLKKAIKAYQAGRGGAPPAGSR
jgi:tetratricopeptide (TPR) repeat protein